MANTTTYELNSTAVASGWIAQMRKSWADYALYRRTLGELMALNDRELRDLGLSRLSIREVAYDSVYGA
jgi:uncharacterized protein YjiS (DUF1127 family)